MKRAVLFSLAVWASLLVAVALVRSATREPAPLRGAEQATRVLLEGRAPSLRPSRDPVRTAPPALDARESASEPPPREEGPEESPEEWILEEEGSSDAELLERAGLPADAPLALRMGRFGPPDPLEVGRAELFLTLRDGATGEAIDGEVVLWRLNAPANVYWTTGDQDVARARVPREGYLFTALPSGEYRPVVLDERAAAPHHAPLHVSARTAHELFVRTPRERPVRFRIPGTPTSVEAYFTGRRSHPRVHVPPWVVARKIQPDFDGVLEFEMVEGDPWFTETTWVPLARTALGYDAGTLREDTRHATVTHVVAVRVDGVHRGEVELRNPPDGDDPVLVFELE